MLRRGSLDAGSIGSSWIEKKCRLVIDGLDRRERRQTRLRCSIGGSYAITGWARAKKTALEGHLDVYREMKVK